MTQEHSITPPPELVQQWATQSPIQANDENWYYEYHIATQAARWGADQELEACKQVILKQQWFAAPGFRLDQLHNARRPKPPSLKEEALAALSRIKSEALCPKIIADAGTIRRALEALPDD